MALSAHTYWLQSTSKTAFNANAEVQKNSPFRTFLVLFNFGSSVIDLFVHAALLNVICDINGVLFWYIICIKIRDREKKKFLLPKMAMIGAS